MRFRENDETTHHCLVNKLRVEMSLHLKDFEGLPNKSLKENKERTLA